MVGRNQSMSANLRVKSLFEMCVRNPKSIIRGNLGLIEKRLKMRLSEVLTNGARKFKCIYQSEVCESDMVALDFIKQLRSVIFFSDSVPGFNSAELGDILRFVCVHSLPVM
jgi:hypothetical protein